MKPNPSQTSPGDSREASIVTIPRRKFFTTCGTVAGGVLMGGDAFAEPEIKLSKWKGTIKPVKGGASPFSLEGTASHLGQFKAIGEIVFVPGEEEGALVGDGIVVFEAANGDQLAGVLGWDLDEETGEGRIHDISWRDAVAFSDGTIATSTGRFVVDRPKGIVTLEYLVLAYILVLGLAFISSPPPATVPRSR